MTTTVEQKTWTKPQMTRLGTIADVAGNNTTNGDPGGTGCASKLNGAVTCS